MYDIVTFGEVMIRLSPPDHQRLEQAHSLDVHAGGAELSVAADTSRLGLRTAWVSKLTNNPLGRFIANKAREQGVDVSHVVWTDEGRIGIYYLEIGSTPRPSQVVYDRANSSINLIKAREVDWAGILAKTKIFHTSGITPALSRNCRNATLKAIEAAKKGNCKVSFDLNYRSKLWSPEEAKECFSKLLDKVDIIITTQFDAETVFGLTGSYEDIARKLTDMFGPSVVAMTLREVRTVKTGAWTSLALADGKIYKGQVYDLEIVDRLGAGDSFTSGFLCGYLEADVETGILYGDSMAALKHTLPGDIAWITKEEVLQRAKSKDFRIQR